MADPTLRNSYIALFEQRMTELSNRLAAGDINLREWQIDLRRELREAYAAQIWAATDGDPSMDDYLKIGTLIQQQDKYLEQFAHDIKDGNVSPSAIASRAQMYARSSQVAYWKQATGGASLPTYPGQQQCLGNCGCEWVDNGDGTFTWKRGKTDSCEDCKRNERIYNPFRPAESGRLAA